MEALGKVIPYQQKTAKLFTFGAWKRIFRPMLKTRLQQVTAATTRMRKYRPLLSLTQIKGWTANQIKNTYFPLWMRAGRERSFVLKTFRTSGPAPGIKTKTRRDGPRIVSGGFQEASVNALPVSSTLAAFSRPLVVDDELMAKALARQGWQIYQAKDAITALATAKTLSCGFNLLATRHPFVRYVAHA